MDNTDNINPTSENTKAKLFKLCFSGEVHHIAGMQSAGTVIAINPDKNAPIFDYADYGIIVNAEDLLDSLLNFQ